MRIELVQAWSPMWQIPTASFTLEEWHRQAFSTISSLL